MFKLFNEYNNSSKYYNEFFILPSLSLISSRNSNFKGIVIRFWHFSFLINKNKTIKRGAPFKNQPPFNKK